ncbi:hypothetical protein SDC9_113600 [bioreactor metagenome]|uniref:Uncharacterized protein n=1 Tax=bioreactor metagenome TaxID=1076179 RepID=A0A645BMI6_9ZZZZ
MRGAEAVKAVHKRILGADGREMGHRRQIHALLRSGGHKHGVPGGAAGHKVRVVAKNRMMVRGDHPGGNVQHVGKELAAHGVHGRDHQHQSLRGGEAGGQRAGLQGTVAGARRAGLGLHLNHVHRGPKQVFPTLGGPFVHLLRHGGRRGDGVDGRNLRKRICHMRRGCVAVHHRKLFTHGIFPSFPFFARSGRLLN